MFWLTASGARLQRSCDVARTSSPPSPAGYPADWLKRRFVSDYSSATASDLHGVPSFDPLSDGFDSQRTALAIGPAILGGKRFVTPRVGSRSQGGVIVLG